MRTEKTYENLHFSHGINAINPDLFPTVFPTHWHKYVECIGLSKSANSKHLPTITINQVSYRLEPGDIVFIWPGELHDIQGNDGHELIGIQFTDSLFNNLPDFSPYIPIFRTYHHIHASNAPDLADGLFQYLNHMVSVSSTKENFSGVECLIYLYEMFMSFGLYIDSNKNELTEDLANGNGKYLEKILLACSYIAENCDQPLTLHATADYVGFSSCYFSRVFKKATNYNFVEYLTWQRVRRSQALLADSSLTITEISYQSGFKSISTFNRVFRQYHGCSPSEYRRYYLR